MSSLMQAGSSALLKNPSFLFFVVSRSFSRFSGQIAAVAVGWQIYNLTGSAFDLGMIGLVQFLPTAVLVFVAGHAADRYARTRVVQVCLLVEALTALFLAWGAYSGSLTVSAAPMIASASSDSHITCDTANTTVATPNTITAWNIRNPTRRRMAWRASTAVISNAPTAGAARSRPSPSGPVCRLSLIHI